MRAARLIAIVVPATVLFALPGAAAAKTLYASPTGPGFLSQCTVDDRCSLEHAVENVAVAGDVVEAAPGTYNVDQLTVPEAITLRGEPGGARPRIVGTATPLSVGPNADGTSIQGLTIDLVGTGLAVLLEGETTIEGSQILVRGPGNTATDADALLAEVRSTLRDTTINVKGGSSDTSRSSVTARGGVLTLRNVTVTRQDNTEEPALTTTRSAAIEADGLTVNARACLWLSGTGRSMIRNLTATQPAGAAGSACLFAGNGARIEGATINSTVDHNAGTAVHLSGDAVVSGATIEAPFGSAVQLHDDARLDRARVTSELGVQLFSSTALTNSLVVVRGDFATRYGGPFGATAQIRNTTLIGGPATNGFSKDGFGTVQIANTIVAAGTDLNLARPGTVVSNSRYVTHTGEPVGDGGANTAADPRFVDGAGGDYRLRPDSPMIDAGEPHDLLGPVDLGGSPRVSGAKPDIGAFEFQQPAPPADLAPSDPAPSEPAPSDPAPSESARVGGSGSAGVAPLDDLAPTLRGVSLRPRHFASGARSPRLRFTLSEPATLSIAIARELPGRRSGRRCVEPSRKLRQAKRCTRLVKRGSLKVDGRSGANSVRFSGRGLKPGPHRLTITPTDAAGNRGRPATAHFSIVSRRNKR